MNLYNQIKKILVKVFISNYKGIKPQQRLKWDFLISSSWKTLIPMRRFITRLGHRSQTRSLTKRNKSITILSLSSSSCMSLNAIRICFSSCIRKMICGSLWPQSFLLTSISSILTKTISIRLKLVNLAVKSRLSPTHKSLIRIRIQPKSQTNIKSSSLSDFSANSGLINLKISGKAVLPLKSLSTLKKTPSTSTWWKKLKKSPRKSNKSTNSLMICSKLRLSR